MKGIQLLRSSSSIPNPMIALEPGRGNSGVAKDFAPGIRLYIVSLSTHIIINISVQGLFLCSVVLSGKRDNPHCYDDEDDDDDDEEKNARQRTAAGLRGVAHAAEVALRVGELLRERVQA